ncbi:MAG: Eco29kI family restriction endonuclease [Candidatus Pacebacteria bacterium]|nr:Eco29kI family restriction endonuclease [Candidatus Paceibacterota bacterium]
MAKTKPERFAAFNPLDKHNLGESVADALLQKPVVTLPPESPFIGAGIYALYYYGPFPLYNEITALNTDNQNGWPIYVGKAVPAGARKGGYGLGAEPGQTLFKRLLEHANSIEQAENLCLADFQCRFLVVDDIWIPLAESLLIEMYSPLWNCKIDGFGNHDPGKGRYNQQRSQWDALHPGRPWSVKLQPPANDEELIRDGVTAYISRTKDELRMRQETLTEKDPGISPNITHDTSS